MEIHREVQIEIPEILPHDKVYAIQVGYKLFKVSGRSLSSDGPSYFTQFFSDPENAGNVLFIDRSPQVFEKIYMHLQGYHIILDTDNEYVHIWQDSYYFRLRRLQKVLQDSPIIANVGGKMFKIPRSLIHLPGNHPNFFSMSLESMTNDIKHLSAQMPMPLPPPQQSSFQANRSATLFSDILELLMGNHLVVRDAEHRQSLAKECRYYRFLQLEQLVIPHKIIRDPFSSKEEIMLNLNNIATSGLKNLSSGFDDAQPLCYARPHVINEKLRSLLVQVNSRTDSDFKLVINRNYRQSFAVSTNTLAVKMGQVFAGMKEHFDEHDQKRLCVPCLLEDANVSINSTELRRDWYLDFYNQEEPDSKRSRTETKISGDFADFKILKSVWRVAYRADKAILQCVSLQAISDRYHLNKELTFL